MALGWSVNHKWTYRIYCKEGLNLRRKWPRRHVTDSRRAARPEVGRPNACCGMDYVVDSLFDDRRLDWTSFWMRLSGDENHHHS